jgi:pullulanase/glycogen debranching enzyme
LENDFVCKNYILNKLDNTSYYMYSLIKNAKALWKTLDKKYKAEDDTWKKFIVIRFLDFKTVNSRTVMNQVQEFQLILYEIHVKGMSLHESFELATIIK